MFLHRLNPVKGWPSNSALDASHKISANVLFDLVPGRVCHQNSAGELEPGVVRWQMGFFLFGGAADLDVMTTPGTTWWPITPRGKVTCFPAKAPMQFWTTEFDTSLTYAPNDPLRAPIGNALVNAATAGVLTNAGVLPIETNNIATASGSKWTAICGLAVMPSNPSVSSSAAAPTTPKYTNVNGISVLSFYPVWYPGHPGE